MNSDREKIECLRVLGEIYKYVLQDKRDPADVAETLTEIAWKLQRIIDKKKEKELKQTILDSIVSKTINGEIQWKLDNDRLIYELASRQRYIADRDCNGHLCVVLWDNAKSCYLPLSSQDEQFFLELLLNLRQKKETEFLKHFA